MRYVSQMTDEIDITDHRAALLILQELWCYPKDQGFLLSLNRLMAPVSNDDYKALIEEVEAKFEGVKQHRARCDDLFWNPHKAPMTVEEARFVASGAYDLRMLESAEEAIAFLRDAGPVKARGPFSVVKNSESLDVVNSQELARSL